MRKIDASDNIYTTESTTGNLFSLTQEGAPLCRIIAKVSFLFGGQNHRPEESTRQLLWWEQLAQEVVLALAFACCVTLEESAPLSGPWHLHL